MMATKSVRLPATAEYREASDALWHASPLLERIGFEVQRIREADERGEPVPPITLEAIGELFAFVDDARAIVGKMADDVARLEEGLRQVNLTRLDRDVQLREARVDA
jgi:hypothetical protein